MNVKDIPRKNHLLDALPKEEYEQLLPYLELVPMELGKALHESGEVLRYAYFPTTCIISLIYEMENGASSEVAVIGNEGMVGVALFMDSGRMQNRAVVISAGYAYRLQGQIFVREFNQNASMFNLMLHYTQALITQMAQTAACNRHHTIDQKLCHWLLLHLDRISGHELIMTHELISSMLGVRREGVTDAVGKLQRAGVVDCRRGHVTVLDRRGLEERVCECYQVVKTEFDRLLPGLARQEPSSPPIRALNSLEGRETNLSPLRVKAVK
jgi:CRP-like cAMP-binding protein